MTTKIFCAFLIIAATSFAAFSQVEPTPTPVKLVITSSMPPIKPASTPRPVPVQTPIIVGDQDEEPEPSVRTNSEAPIIVGRPNSNSNTGTKASTAPQMSGTNLNTRGLSFGQIKSKIAEAKRQMQSRPIATAFTEGTVPNETVRVAFLDAKTNGLDYLLLTKESFLSTASDKAVTSQNGRSFTVRTIRGNGVNTPIMILDESGKQHLPLIVQYPVVREGRYMETAYYMSTHPGLVTPEVVNAGRYYVRNVIEIARERLRDKGVTIQPKVADIAERLSTVEHVDHMRFRTEPHANIFNDIFTLYALNEGQTYRYSVSSAGAGGMVQMIPATYRMVRSRYPQVSLMPDFVEGMRNHVNATQAMLLYMQWTWNDMNASPTIQEAVASGIATQEQLMAAGYNSNPARLAGYINRGGEGWTNLIPRETKIYLQIWDSIERFVPMNPRGR
jgi:hypothetical protein